MFYSLIFFFKSSSLKIPLLHHAASFNTEAERGRMVKEWDFEAGKKFKNSKITNIVLCLIAIIGRFQCDPWCLPTQNWLKNATNDISILEFHKVTRHYVKDNART
jgi:hypothetical protein